MVDNGWFSEEALIAGAASLGLSLALKQIADIRKFGELLYERNKKFNLTRINKDTFLRDHILDSLTPVLVPGFRTSEKILDLGTGPGLPGLPLKIVLPELKLTLLDSRNKAIGFVREVVRELALNDTEVVCERSEVLLKNEKFISKFDYVVSRAVAKISDIIPISSEFLKDNGKLILFKSAGYELEIEDASESAVSHAMKYLSADPNPECLRLGQRRLVVYGRNLV